MWWLLLAFIGGFLTCAGLVAALAYQQDGEDRRNLTLSAGVLPHHR